MIIRGNSGALLIGPTFYTLYSLVFLVIRPRLHERYPDFSPLPQDQALVPDTVHRAFSRMRSTNAAEGEQ